MASESYSDWRSWLSPRNKRFWVVAIFITYSLAGFVLLPWAVKRELAGLTQQFLKCESSVAEVSFNPWILRFRAQDLTLYELDNTVLLQTGELVADAELSGIFSWALRFSEAPLRDPVIELQRYADGSSNVERVLRDMGLEQSAGAEDEAPPSTDGESGVLRLMVDSVLLERGIIHLRDAVPATPFDTHVGPINITVNDLSSLPEDAGVRSVSISTETNAELRWSGSLQLVPLASAGSVELSGSPLPIVYRYFQDLLGFTLDDGGLQVRLDYSVATDAQGELSAEVSNLHMRLKDVAVDTLTNSEELFRLPELELSGGVILWPAQTIEIESIAFKQPAIQVEIRQDGSLNLDGLIVSAEESDSAPVGVPVIVEAVDAKDNGVEWKIGLKALEIRDLAASFTDNSLKEPGTLEFQKFNLTLSDVSNIPGSKAGLSIDAKLPESGALSVKGDLIVLPDVILSTALSIDNLALESLQPWIEAAAKIQLKDGLFSLKGTLNSSPDNLAALSADIDIAELRISDTLENEPLIGWKNLGLEDAQFSLADNKLELSRVVLKEPFARIIIEKDSTTNFQALGNADAPMTETTQENTAEQAEPQNPLVIQVGETRVTNGSVDFSDLSLPLPFRALVSEFGGQIGAIASNSNASSKLEFEGKVGEYGLTTLTGDLNVMDPIQKADVLVLFSNVSMPDLSPYTAEFAGKMIESGKLDLDLNYSLAKGMMKGENKVVLRQFKLGEKVPAPDAMSLPLDLAIALLRDVNGVIDLKLNVSGDVNDPDFSAGGIILKAFVNLITKAVAAPFKLLGAIIPGGDSGEFDAIDFRAGRADLAPPEQEKLAQLVTALVQRPALSLDIPSGFNAVSDRPALQEAKVDAEISRRLGENSEDGEQLTRQTRKALERMADEQNLLGDLSLGDLRDQHQRSIPDTDKIELDELGYMNDLRKRLETAQLIDDSELDALAVARGASIAASLSEAGLGPERYAQTEPSKAKIADNGWVRIELKLEAADPAAGKQDAAPATP